jgi:hypothetical protein
MKIFNWIRKTAANVVAFVKSTIKGAGEVITDAYDMLDDATKEIVRIAVPVVQTIKTFNDSKTCDVITSILATAIPGVKDDAIILAVRTWIKKEFPKIAIQLEIVDTWSNLEGTDKKIKGIIERMQAIDGRGAKALEFATSLTLYLSDGKLTRTELESAVSDYYNKYIKDNKKWGQI